MQALNWYYRRLKAMSADEILWRMRSSLRDRVDRCFVGRRQRARILSAILNGNGYGGGPGFHVCHRKAGERDWLGTDQVSYESLLRRATKMAENRLTFFDLKDVHLGDPIAWNRDHKRGQDTPLVFSSTIDYRDTAEAGDCKHVWEPNRHHQLVVLGRAYRLSGDVRFARAVADQLSSWLEQNPYGLGMNWRSGLELGIRLINWAWALDLIRESGVIDQNLHTRLLDSVARHVWEIDRKYSRGSSVNNHLIGEAAGVFIAASYWPKLKHASRWRARSWGILGEEIINQTHGDGGTKEQAIGYHLFILQFFVTAGIVARATHVEFPGSYWSRLEKMFEFLAVLQAGGDCLPAFGDGDDGYVLDLGDHPRCVAAWLAVGAALFARGDFKTAAGTRAEPIAWLLGEEGIARFKALPEVDQQPCRSVALAETGYYLLQQGDSDERISVVFDCGPLGMGALAAHGHADALSFTLRAFGRDVLVDPGTYDYFSYPRWREYLRSTRAHNTVVIDGANQSEMLGLFLWGRRAHAECLVWEPAPTGGLVTGRHDGYHGLDDPVTHRRTLELDGTARVLTVRDEIAAQARHDLEIYFHLAEHCVVQSAGPNRFVVNVGAGDVTMAMDPRLEVRVYQGRDDPIFGWVSRGYHQKEPGTTLVGSCRVDGSTSLTSRIEIGAAKRGRT